MRGSLDGSMDIFDRKLLVFVGPYVGLTQPYVGGVYTCWSNQGCDVTKDPLHPFLG